MCMLLTNSAAIRDVLLFPTMKTQGGAKNEANNSVQAKTEEKPAEKNRHFLQVWPDLF